ncbi:MAG: hypothetical protein V1690_03925 [Candidatus Moraniibacteriota bacterium]
MKPMFTRFKNGVLDGCDDRLLLSPYPGVNWCDNCYCQSYCGAYSDWILQKDDLHKEAA